MMNFKRAYILILSIGLLTCVPGLGYGAIINVPADQPTIQAGINAAVSGADEVVIADGTYTGAGNIDIDFLGKAITVRSANGPANVIIDVQNQAGSRGFIFQNQETSASILQGVTIRNGNADFGGGIRIQNGFQPTAPSPTIINCIIENNTAVQGGGVNISGPGASPTFRNVQILDNTATTPANIGVGGGGLRAARTTGTTTVTIIDSLIDGNSSTGSGGGILIGRATLNLIKSTVSNNSTTGYNGGGIAVNGGQDNNDLTIGQFANAIIHSSSIFGNRAWQKGGGLRFDHILPTQTLEVVNTLIYDNISSDDPLGAAGDGAAIDAWQASPLIVNTTITGNVEADDKSIVFIHTDGQPNFVAITADATFANSILFGNTTAGQLVDTTQAAPGVSTTVGITYSIVNPFIAGTGNSNSNPLFVNTGADDYHLQIASPAIDAGNSTVLRPDIFDVDNDLNVIEAVPDRDGATRLFDELTVANNGAGASPFVDLGAFELGNGVLKLEFSGYTPGEGAGTVTVNVERIGGSTGAISVDIATSDGTAIDGSDYTANSATLSWLGGDSTSKSFTVNISEDNLEEDNERFQVTLSNPTGGSALGAIAQAFVNIIDNDGPGGAGGAVGAGGGGGGGGGGCFITSLMQ